MTKITASIAITILIIVIGAVGIMAYKKDIEAISTSVSGYWIGNDQFLYDHNYTDFQLFISPKTNNKYHGYIIIARDDEILYNSPVTITLSVERRALLDIHGIIQFKNHGDYDIQMPDSAQIKWKVTGEQLVIYDPMTKKVIFDGYKDIYTSIVSNKEWNEPEEDA
jgi:hypothetical protein